MDNDVLINRKDFLMMLKPIKRFASRKQAEDAVLSLEGGNFMITLVGLSSGASVSGNWTGEVRVPVGSLVGIAMLPPAGDPIRLVVRDGRLHIGTVSISCVAQKAWKSKIELPLDPDLVTVLRLRFLYPPDRLERAGLTRRLAKAEEKAGKLVTRAANILKPLNITGSDLVQMVQDHIRRGMETK
ncbi:MAG: hypothetical protein COZ12_05870 [Deltaproteobacteria bacterium CG_4_10_14_3_um_filter_60_8]|nr:MAG: hypothetical protein COX17_07955 [Deltaproteobacteria bacterium CG23_combo_of_CG06-09_8_20_14_all_60_8]PIY21221.1 MAG: hypothetical protein COZ12_05870 [Deltaproteobacteria bacterium CG_4_10_14_3_um_filter_60_8]